MTVVDLTCSRCGKEVLWVSVLDGRSICDDCYDEVAKR